MGLPTTLQLGAVTFDLRRAGAADVPDLVALLAADQLGGTPDGGPDFTPYLHAFEAIDVDPAQVLLVVTRDDEVVATLQLTFIPALGRRGALRAQIQAVRVTESERGNGLGGAMIEWAVAESRRRGCALVQLATDKQRTDAQRFYQRLGFVASHEGMKLSL